MKSVILRIKEKNGFILYERPDYKKFPPLTKYFILCDKLNIYRDVKTLRQAEQLFKVLTTKNK